jgi:hypothetical protein
MAREERANGGGRTPCDEGRFYGKDRSVTTNAAIELQQHAFHDHEQDGDDARGPLASLGMILFGPRWRKGLFCMLHAFFDESESQNPNDVLVLAGCVSTVERWIEFNRSWSEVLARHGIDRWHSSDWRARRGAFGGLSDEEHRSIGEEVMGLIEGDNLLQAFIEVIPLRLYRKEFVPILERDSLRSYRDPYFFCFLSLLKQISMARKDGLLPDEPVKCLFEMRNYPKPGPGVQDRRIMTEYERVRHTFFPREFGPILPGTKVDPEFVPCQAADRVANEAMYEARRTLFRRNLPQRNALRALTERGKLHGGSFSQRETWRVLLASAAAHQAGFGRLSKR